MSETDAPDPAGRALQALRERRYGDAVTEADAAIRALLHDGLDVDDLLRLSLRGAPAEAILRYERGAMARIGRLHAPLALRWEALRRAGRRDEARQMRALCLHHFPERASVWATAGNQALDEDDLALAERCFDRCLALAARWTAALAGKAITLESRKDFEGALPYRRAVVERERALDRDDPVSLQRVIRYAAALGRLGRWSEASPLLRRCITLGAFEQLPQERAVLLRVFSGPLRAPAVLAALYARDPRAFDGCSDDVREALRRAAQLAAVSEALAAPTELAGGERLGLLGMVAWLAGDLVRACALLDEAEVHASDDLAVQHLLLRCARALDLSERPSIERFARSAAETSLARVRNGGTVSDEARFYANATLALLDGCAPPAPPASDAALACAPLDAKDPELLRALRAHITVAVAAGGSDGATGDGATSAAATSSKAPSPTDPASSPRR